MINGKTAIDKKEKADAFGKLQEIVTDAQHSLDLALAAGTLATTMCTARSDAVQDAEIQEETVKGTKELDQDFNDLKDTDMDIVAMDQEETIEHMQPDVEGSDTEPNPLPKTQSGVINEMEESEGKHSGTNCLIGNPTVWKTPA